MLWIVHMCGITPGTVEFNNMEVLSVAQIFPISIHHIQTTVIKAIDLFTNSIDIFLKGIDVVKAFILKHSNNGLLGLHLEGPYINPIKRGAHLLEHIKHPTLDEVKLLLDKSEGIVKMMTLAPEQCNDEVIQLLLDNKVVVSAGHSNATYEQATAGFNKGITTATHLFNAMSPLQGRELGMVGAIYDHATAHSSIVCDGFHTSFSAVRISKKMMQERLFLITDAVTETSDGAYQHVLKDDHYVLPDGTLSGSALTMIKAVNNCIKQAGIEFDEAFIRWFLISVSIIKASFNPVKTPR